MSPTAAKANVAAGNIMSDQMIRESRSNTSLELDRINRERRRLTRRSGKSSCPKGWSYGRVSNHEWCCPPGWACGFNYAYNLNYHKNVPCINRNINLC